MRTKKFLLIISSFSVISMIKAKSTDRVAKAIVSPGKPFNNTILTMIISNTSGLHSPKLPFDNVDFNRTAFVSYLNAYINYLHDGFSMLYPGKNFSFVKEYAGLPSGLFPPIVHEERIPVLIDSDLRMAFDRMGASALKQAADYTLMIKKIEENIKMYTKAITDLQNSLNSFTGVFGNKIKTGSTYKTFTQLIAGLNNYISIEPTTKLSKSMSNVTAAVLGKLDGLINNLKQLTMTIDQDLVNSTIYNITTAYSSLIDDKLYSGYIPRKLFLPHFNYSTGSYINYTAQEFKAFKSENYLGAGIFGGIFSGLADVLESMFRLIIEDVLQPVLMTLLKFAIKLFLDNLEVLVVSFSKILYSLLPLIDQAVNIIIQLLEYILCMMLKLLIILDRRYMIVEYVLLYFVIVKYYPFPLVALVILLFLILVIGVSRMYDSFLTMLINSEFSNTTCLNNFTL